MSEVLVHGGAEDNNNPWQQMANEVSSGELATKQFYETDMEFGDSEKIKEFRDTILNADDERAKEIIDSRIALLEASCDKADEIGVDRAMQHIHRGYIGSETRVRFQGGIAEIGSEYRLRNTDYLYEAIAHLRRNKEQINNGLQLFYNVESYLDSYFGIPDLSAGDQRMNIINEKAGLSNPELTDDEFFAAIDEIDISYFKGEHVAQCSERTAMAQNIISLFGYETYYVNGGVSIDGNREAHAYNVIADNAGKKKIMDFSVASNLAYHGSVWNVPTQGRVDDFEGLQYGGRVATASFEGYVGNDGKIVRRKTHDVVYDAEV